MAALQRANPSDRDESEALSPGRENDTRETPL